jgi:hypothetical protein
MERIGESAWPSKRTGNIPIVASPVSNSPVVSPRQFVSSSSPSSSKSGYLEGKAKEAAMKTALGGLQSAPHEGEGRKRRTTTLVVMKKPAQVTTFPDVVVKRRRAISEPFLASWDYSAQHTCLTVQLCVGNGAVEVDVEPESESDLREEEDEEGPMPSQTTASKRGTQRRVSEMQDMVAGVKLDDPLQYYGKLEQLPDEVRMGSVDGRAVVVSGTFRGLVSALLTDLGIYQARRLSDDVSALHELSAMSSSSGDETYLETFLATHRYFTDAVTLMKRLQYLYETPLRDFDDRGRLLLSHAPHTLDQLSGDTTRELCPRRRQLQDVQIQAGRHSPKASLLSVPRALQRWSTLSPNGEERSTIIPGSSRSCRRGSP